jgi:hypothetical protein
VSLSYLFSNYAARPSNATRARRAASSSPSSSAGVKTESLEARQLLSVSLRSDGYTSFNSSSDSKVIYVSTSGSDSNSGSINSPVRSIAKGISMMRSGMPDQVLLKRGETWHENVSFSKSGRSSSEPAVLGAYGTGSRPTIDAGGVTAIDIASGWANNVAIQGLHIYSGSRDPNGGHFSRTSGGYGIRFVAGTTNAVVEDCKIDFFRFDTLFQAFNNPQSNVKLRRNIISNSYGLGVGSSGIYAQGVNGLTLQENVWDHNGWNEQVSGAGANALSHNAYLSEKNNNVVVTGNIFSNASSHGLQTRAGGNVTNNLFLNNPVGMSYGLVNGDYLKAGGVSGNVSGNVFMGGRSIGGSARGWAIQLGNIKSATVSNNIMTDDASGQMGAISLETGGNLKNASSGVGINNLTIENNIVNKWYMAMELSGSLKMGGSGYTGVHNLVVRNNQFQNVDSQWNRIISHSGSMSSSVEHWSYNKYYDNSSNSQWFFQGTSTVSLSSWKSKLEPTAVASQSIWKNPNVTISSYAGSASNFVTGASKMQIGSFGGTYSAAAVISYVRSAFNLSSSYVASPTPTPTSSGGTTTTSGDTTKPYVTGKGTASSSIWVSFSEDVTNSLSAGDLVLKNSSTGATISGLSYKKGNGYSGVWWWPNYNGGYLPHGTYTASIAAANVKDFAGNTLASNWSTTFTV